MPIGITEDIRRYTEAQEFFQEFKRGKKNIKSTFRPMPKKR
jgi:hypothetical protein